MKFSRIVFLDSSEVIRAHGKVVSRTGGSPGIRDHGLLESAVNAPRTTVFGEPAYPSLASMAAALGYALAKNHAFVDGNKRIAALAIITFLNLNGIEFQLLRKKRWIRRFERLAAGQLSRDELAADIAGEMFDGDVVVTAD